MKREEDGWGYKVAMGIVAVVVLGPMLFYVLFYAFVYVVCSLDACFGVGL